MLLIAGTVSFFRRDRTIPRDVFTYTKRLAFPIKYDEMRVAVVAIFQYTVHYYSDQNKNTVFVSCVFHDNNDSEIPISIK